MKRKLIILLNGNEELVEFFKKSDDFDVVATTNSGVKGLELAREHRPDAVICDMILSDIDGLTVLDGLAELKLDAKKIIYSALDSDEIIKLATSHGADLYVARPASPEALHKLILLLFVKQSTVADGDRRRFSEDVCNAAELRISNVFLSAGIPPHIKGYGFLRMGVMLSMLDPTVLSNITKKLYPTIAEEHSTTPSKVERAIRHAIEVAWNRGRIENLNSVFGVNFYQSGDKPTNGEFIAFIADRIIQEIHMGKLG